MDIGKRNRLVTLRRPATGEYPDGQPMTGWVDVTKVWANVRYLNGVETVKAGAVASLAKASIRILRRTDVTADWQAGLGTTNFQIKAVLPDEEDMENVDLVCEVIA